MRHCIVCHADYASNPVACPDCGTRTLDPGEHALWTTVRDDLTQEAMVPVHVFDGPVDRAIISEILEDEGVPHMTKGNDFGGATLTAQGGGWGVLLVAEDAVTKAKGLVQDYLNSTMELPGQ
jgi:hypothetical protein